MVQPKTWRTFMFQNRDIDPAVSSDRAPASLKRGVPHAAQCRSPDRPPLGTAASPGPIVTNLDPTFKWSAVSGVSGYQIHIYDKTDGKYISANVGQTATSYKPSAGALKPGDQFVWDVRDLLSTSTTATGPVSNYLNFSLHHARPDDNRPGLFHLAGPVLTTLTPTLTWHAVTAVTGFTGYQINLYDNIAHKLQSFVASPTATSFKLPAGGLSSRATPTSGTCAPGWKPHRSGNLPTSTSTPRRPRRFPSPPSSLPAAPYAGPKLTTLTPTLQWHAVTGVSGLAGYLINLYDITTGHLITHTVVRASRNTRSPQP